MKLFLTLSKSRSFQFILLGLVGGVLTLGDIFVTNWQFWVVIVLVQLIALINYTEGLIDNE